MKKKWQHEETGYITDAEHSPGNRWFEVRRCENGISGCIMSPGHRNDECFTEEMLKNRDFDHSEEVDKGQSADVIQFGGTTVLDLDPSKIIEGLKDKEFREILVIAIDENGELYTASHTSDIPKILFNIRHAQKFYETLAFGAEFE